MLKTSRLKTVYEIETILRTVEKIPENLAYSIEDTNPTKDNLFRILETVVKKNPEIYGSTVAFEPYAFDSKKAYFAPYVYRR